MYPIDFVSRMQRASLMGVYGPRGQLQSRFSPYLQLGDTSEPYDLNRPGAVLEIKRALIALANMGADPVQNKDPIKEDLWHGIVTDGDYADAWDGPTADEFVLCVSRYRKHIDGPYIQTALPPPVGVVGGPQPRAHGLELIAIAIEQFMGGYPPMSEYLAWRAGKWAPGTMANLSAPSANAPVKMCTKRGEFWNPAGYTPLWDGAAQQLKDDVHKWDDALTACWTDALKATNEQERSAFADCFKTVRLMRHFAVLKANEGAPAVPCGAGWQWDPKTSTCEKLPSVVTLPEVTIDLTEEEDQQREQKAGIGVPWWLIGSSLAGLVYWAFR